MGYLKNKHNTRLVFDPTYPDIDYVDFPKYDWTEFYGEAKELLPADMPPPPEVSDDQWAGYIAHRVKARKPLTARAYTLLVAALAEHATDEWPPGAIVDEMVQRVWLSFKPEWLPRKSDTRNGQRHHHRDPDELQNPMVRALRNAEAREARQGSAVVQPRLLS
jgi:hypothetical protein